MGQRGQMVRQRGQRVGQRTDGEAERTDGGHRGQGWGREDRW